MNQGTIIKILRRYAIVMSDSMDFDTILIKDGMQVGMHIYYGQEDLYQKDLQIHNKTNMLLKAAAAFCIVFMVLIGVEHFRPEFSAPYQSPVAVVTVDINPSMELLIDREGLVLDVIGLNSDGIELAKAFYYGETIEKVLQQIMEDAKGKGFMDSEGHVLVAAWVDDEAMTDDLDSRLETFFDLQETASTIIYCKAEYEVLSQARASHISLGRMKINELVDDSDISDEALMAMNVSEMVADESVAKELSEAEKKGDLVVFVAEDNSDVTSDDSGGPVPAADKGRVEEEQDQTPELQDDSSDESEDVPTVTEPEETEDTVQKSGGHGRGKSKGNNEDKKSDGTGKNN